MKISVFKFLWPYFYKLKKPLLISLSVMAVSEAFSRIAIFYGSRLIGLISSAPTDRHTVIPTALLFIVLYTVFMGIRGVMANYCIKVDAYFLPSLQARAYKDLFTIAHRHSPQYFEQEMSGNISSKIENVVSQIERFYYTLTWGVINPAIVLIISLSCIAMIDVILAIALFALILIYTYLMYKTSRVIMPYSKATAQATSLANGELIDSLINAETVKSFGRRFYENRHYFDKLLKVTWAEIKETNMGGWIYIAQSLMRSLIQIVLCILPLWFWYQDKLSLADFVFVQGIVMSLIYVFSSMIDFFLKFFNRYTIIQDGLALLFKPCQVEDIPNAAKLSVTKGSLNFSDITYAYEGIKPIFQNFSLSIKPQNKIGLVGYSGSGKSTLIKLLNRYYNLDAGSIFIDGQDIATVTQRSLHQNIAMIPQEPNLFNRTIMENIRYGNLNASDEDVFEAARKAYCHDFICALPQGYSSRVGERGVMLSGGERQRIAIARAILRNSPILVLDEATSALDSESEKYIQASLAELMKGRTVIAIAHRLSTLKKMDKIVVLDKGRISEIGTHTALLRQKGIYADFYQMQTSAFKNEK